MKEIKETALEEDETQEPKQGEEKDATSAEAVVSDKDKTAQNTEDVPQETNGNPLVEVEEAKHSEPQETSRGNEGETISEEKAGEGEALSEAKTSEGEAISEEKSSEGEASSQEAVSAKENSGDEKAEVPNETLNKAKQSEPPATIDEDQQSKHIEEDPEAKNMGITKFQSTVLVSSMTQIETLNEAQIVSDPEQAAVDAAASELISETLQQTKPSIPRFPRTYMGGYRNKNTGVEYYHCTTQTITPHEIKQMVGCLIDKTV